MYNYFISVANTFALQINKSTSELCNSSLVSKLSELPKRTRDIMLEDAMLPVNCLDLKTDAMFPVNWQSLLWQLSELAKKVLYFLPAVGVDEGKVSSYAELNYTASGNHFS